MEDSRMSAIAILYILKEYSDEAHPLSSNACIPLLEQVYDIKINRGTILESTSRQPIGAII